jgi:hypothetical protein
MSTLEFVAGGLARAFLSGAWTRAALARRARDALGRKARWIVDLAARVHDAFPAADSRPGLDELRAFLLAAPELVRAWRRALARGRPRLRVQRQCFVSHEFVPASGAPARWDVPALSTPADLARWLGLEIGELEWFADAQGRLQRHEGERLHHYSYRWISKRRGAPRLIESPKGRLKDLQRRVLGGILDRVPPHDAAHGFRRGRSILTHAAKHSGTEAVLTLDLRGFFPSIGGGRVRAIFRALGYPQPVARLLAGLTANRVPESVLRRAPAPGIPWSERQRYRRPHLPQGSPCSPALANIAAFRLDLRLAAAARAFGAAYSRYADDLAFSGGPLFASRWRRFAVATAAIAIEEGFEIHARKTRMRRQGARQRVTGLVVNAHPNVPRRDYERLKAILTNCVRRGPESQNRAGLADFKAHLAGRIAQTRHVHRGRGEKLRRLFEGIRWQ